MAAKKDTAPSADAIKGDVEKQVKEDEAKGYHGSKVDPLPNSAYTLESGPDSPPTVEDDRTPIAQQSANKEG